MAKFIATITFELAISGKDHYGLENLQGTVGYLEKRLSVIINRLECSEKELYTSLEGYFEKDKGKEVLADYLLELEKGELREIYGLLKLRNENLQDQQISQTSFEELEGKVNNITYDLSCSEKELYASLEGYFEKRKGEHVLSNYLLNCDKQKLREIFDYLKLKN